MADNLRTGVDTVALWQNEFRSLNRSSAKYPHLAPLFNPLHLTVFHSPQIFHIHFIIVVNLNISIAYKQTKE